MSGMWPMASAEERAKVHDGEELKVYAVSLQP